jgi:hypothetical protein
VAYHAHPQPKRGAHRHRLGVTVKEAIKAAIRDYGITDPEGQRRLIAQRLERA